MCCPFFKLFFTMLLNANITSKNKEHWSTLLRFRMVVSILWCEGNFAPAIAKWKPAFSIKVGSYPVSKCTQLWSCLKQGNLLIMTSLVFSINRVNSWWTLVPCMLYEPNSSHLMTRIHNHWSVSAYQMTMLSKTFSTGKAVCIFF